MYIMGFSCYYHDSAAALLHNGLLIAAAEEERFSRVKHDARFPSCAIGFCLKQAGIHIKDVDYFVFYEKPLLKFDRFYRTILQSFPRSRNVYRQSWSSPNKEKLWVRGELLRRLDIQPAKLLFVEHHISHAASAFFCSPFEEAAVLTIDGVGEWSTATIGYGTAAWPEGSAGSNSLNLFEEIRYPHSLGLMYTAFTSFLGFQPYEGEYKVMGMAPYGRPTRVEDIYRHVLKVDDTGAFRLNMDYIPIFHALPWNPHHFSEKFLSLFGEPREPESEFFTLTTHPRRDHPDWDEEQARENQRYADIAASVQTVIEETVLRIARYAHERTGSKKLCMAGGVALNSVANGRVLREGPFEEVFIQPAAADSGGALGAALYVYHVLLRQPRVFVMRHAYWGQEYSPDDIGAAIERTGRPFRRVEDREKLAHLIVEDLLAGKVVGLYQGRFEWGPRALGNRSILADPRRREMKAIVNESIKFREPFRPFAPAVLEDRAGEFYEDLVNPESQYPLRYMLMVFRTREEQADRLQAVNHAGNTGRLQTVRAEWNPLYHRAIELFGEATGVPVVLNTSFNLRGEPIVTTPANALNTFDGSGLETLYLDGYIVRK